MSRTPEEILAYCGEATEGPWECGGPVTREAVVKELTGFPHPNGLTAQVWEIGMEGQRFVPGLALVNEDPDRKCEENARFIVNARADLPRMAKEVMRLRALCGEAAEGIDEYYDEQTGLSKRLKAAAEGKV